MRLPAYAQKMGVTYQTAYSWFVNNKIPGAYKLPSGTIIIPDEDIVTNERTKTVVYARVSSNEQRKTNLETQAERLTNFCISNGWVVDQVVKEVGSGLNDNRAKLETVLKDPALKRIVVEHRDRLTRFGYNYLQILAQLQGFEIIVVNKTLDNDKDDLLADFTAIITSFCARLYSKCRSKKISNDIKNSLPK